MSACSKRGSDSPNSDAQPDLWCDRSTKSPDFLLHELPTVIDRLAEDYERSTVATADVGAVRAFISSGTLVAHFAVYTELTDDGAVEIFYFELARWVERG